MTGVEVKMNTVFSMGISKGLSRWPAGLALVLGMALVGCRGCSSSEPVDDEVKVQAKQKDDRAEKKKRRLSTRADLKKLRSLKLRAPQAAEADRELSEAVEQSRRLVEQNDAEGAQQAVSLLEPWLAEHPDDADALYWIGRARVVVSELDQAIEHFEAATKADAAYVLPYRWITYTLNTRRKYAEAMPFASKAVELTPADPDVYVDRALSSLRARQFDTLVQDLEKACSLGDDEVCEVVSAARVVVQRSERTESTRRSRSKGESTRSIGTPGKFAKAKKGGKLGLGLGMGVGKGKGKAHGGGGPAGASERAGAGDADETTTTE